MRGPAGTAPALLSLAAAFREGALAEDMRETKCTTRPRCASSTLHPAFFAPVLEGIPTKPPGSFSAVKLAAAARLPALLWDLEQRQWRCGSSQASGRWSTAGRLHGSRILDS
ncbi:hypothetical protein OBBRIDRAFT_838026 [Obba rivulosa]|uniref:Secreted protein n=1 Tax=Obba rivulosa TaxID=1052685 RepID=A0A8E2AWC3_9APHY|nr:hypothetical protein OBBRIDRAFT_838026 [Obba rivulosa]